MQTISKIQKTKTIQSTYYTTKVGVLMVTGEDLSITLFNSDSYYGVTNLDAGLKEISWIE